jgi:hypothetical protein
MRISTLRPDRSFLGSVLPIIIVDEERRIAIAHPSLALAMAHAKRRLFFTAILFN